MTVVDASQLRRGLDLDELVAVAQELIRYPSVNPPGDESAAAAFVAAELERLGAHAVAVVSAGEGRDSVTARWGKPGGRVLAWNGHLDVVDPGDEASWRFGPFEAHVAEGRLWGRGTADMKGSVAAMLQSLAIIRRLQLPIDGELLITVVADEEAGGKYGAGYLAESGMMGTADAGICGEPTSLRPLVAARGRLWLEVEAIGVAAHASTPELGRNAISAIVDLAGTLSQLELSDAPHPLLGPATLTPTMITGGESPNSVAGRCTLTLDRRFPPGQSADTVREQIDDVVAQVMARHHVEWGVVERVRFDSSEIDADSEIVGVAARAVEAVTGSRPEVGGIPGSTDARFLIAAGIPTVIFGPGELALAHTVDESIAVSDLAEGALAYAATIADFLGGRQDH